MSRRLGATPEGVYDLAGNIEEWVFDKAGHYEPGPAANPTGPDVAVPPNVALRELRGGAWRLDATYLAGFWRDSWTEDNSSTLIEQMAHVGFRVVWPGERGPDAPPIPR